MNKHIKKESKIDSPNKYSIESKQNKVTVRFMSSSWCNDFARMEFHSRLLHSLSPNEQKVWVKSERLDAEIIGWPKNIEWEKVSENEFVGKVINISIFNFNSYKEELEQALSGICEGMSLKNNLKIYNFKIKEGSTLYEYNFYSKARTIAVLCVLFDMKAHPRNELEINIPQSLGPKIKWPLNQDDKVLVRTYGDPSKTADVLRNEGWPRLGENTAMKVFRQKIHGAQQQMYELLKKEQTLDSRVMRTNIGKRWKTELYESQNYTCQICNTKYPSELLEPDHRVPVIVEEDNLSDANFKTKLMTLCRFCNQQKREFCKRLPHDYDWQNSPWAYPEKFALEKIKLDIENYSKKTGLKFDEIIKLLK